MHKKIYLSLESIRGIAALLVAFYHFNGTFHFSLFAPLKIVGTFWLMVDLFFVLSGFVIVYNYKGKLVDGESLGTFYFRRVGRLYPLFVFTTLFFFLEPLAEFIQGSGGEIPFTLSWKEGLSYFFMLQGFGITDRGLLNYTSWSIGVEVQLYVLFSLFLFFRTKSNFIGRFSIPILAILSLLSLAFIYFKYHNIELMYEAGLARGILSFGLGSIIALLTDKFKQSQSPLGDVFTTAILIFIVVILGLRNHNLNFSVPFLFALLIYFLVFFPEGYISKFMEFKPLVFLGAISYSMYLNHPIFIKIIHKFFHNNNPSTTLQIAVTIAYLGGLIIFSKLTYEFVERPFMKYFNQLVKNRQAMKIAHYEEKTA